MNEPEPTAYENGFRSAMKTAEFVMEKNSPSPAQLFAILQAYEDGLNQLMEDAKKDGKQILAFHEPTSVWRIAACPPGGSWLEGLIKWRPMPPAIEGVSDEVDEPSTEEVDKEPVDEPTPA